MENTVINYHERFPRVKMELSIDATSTSKNNLRRDLLDAACLTDDSLPKTDWCYWHKFDISLVIVANPSHQLSGLGKLKKLKIEDLSGQDFVLMEELALYTIFFQRIMASNDIECHSFLKLQSADMAKSLVEKESFLSVLPLYTVQDSVRQGSLKILDIPELNQTQSVQIVLHRNKALTPQIKGFMEVLRDVFVMTFQK